MSSKTETLSTPEGQNFRISGSALILKHAKDLVGVAAPTLQTNEDTMRRRHVDKHVSKPGRGTGWDTQHDLKPAKIQYAFHIFLHKALDRERGRCQPMGYRIAVPNVHALRASNSSAQHKNSGIKLLPSIDPTWASLRETKQTIQTCKVEEQRAGSESEPARLHLW
eukprot:360133-Chlamydomonas_euryale.AAC.5